MSQKRKLHLLGKRPFNSNKVINWPTVILSNLSVVVTIIGWIIINKQNIDRDELSKTKETRIEFLKTTYLKMANAVARDTNSYGYQKDLESAFSEVQLFGNKLEADLARDQIIVNSRPGLMYIKCDSILQALRQSLRTELALPGDTADILSLRFATPRTQQ